MLLRDPEECGANSQKMLSNISLFRIQEGNLHVSLLCNEVVVTLVGDLGPEHTHKKTLGGSLIDREPFQIQAPPFLSQRQCPRGIIQKALRKQEGRESASLLEAGRPMIWGLTSGRGLVLPPPVVEGKARQKSKE